MWISNCKAVVCISGYLSCISTVCINSFQSVYNSSSVCRIYIQTRPCVCPFVCITQFNRFTIILVVGSKLNFYLRWTNTILVVTVVPFYRYACRSCCSYWNVNRLCDAIPCSCDLCISFSDCCDHTVFDSSNLLVRACPCNFRFLCIFCSVPCFNIDCQVGSLFYSCFDRINEHQRITCNIYLAGCFQSVPFSCDCCCSRNNCSNCSFCLILIACYNCYNRRIRTCPFYCRVCVCILTVINNCINSCWICIRTIWKIQFCLIKVQIVFSGNSVYTETFIYCK